jgi:hypothetical protein
MKAIRTIAGQYNEDDIYNMDESGLYWRMPPSQSLSSINRAGVRKDKTRISMICCVNASGTDRLPIWVIGNTCKPRALRNINVSAIGIRWQWNKNAWTNQIIMREWLLDFYQHIGQRSIVLAMDNLPAHLSGLQLAPPPPNIRICWLPKISTSRSQPLDQGIIQNLKVYYRRQWLRYMLSHYERNLDPLESVTILDCIRWLARSWHHDVQSSTIFACFYRSTLVVEPIQLPVEAPDLRPLYMKVQQSGRLSNCMDISLFLNPAEESQEFTSFNEMSSEAVLITEASGNADPFSNDLDEDSAEPAPLPKPQEALAAVRLLISYMDGQDASKAPFLRSLERLERDLEAEIITAWAQGTLNS